MWGATEQDNAVFIYSGISIHAPRVGSDYTLRCAPPPEWISIHAPRVGSDLLRLGRGDALALISIHAPRVGSDPVSVPSALGR